MSALEKNKTWEIVDKLKGKNVVVCNWWSSGVRWSSLSSKKALEVVGSGFL